MTKKQKQTIDRVIGYGLCVILRIPCIVLEKILRRDHAMPPREAPKRIVVAKYLGIGSILQATPMLKGLKDKYPNAQLTFLTLNSNKTLLSRYEFIDDAVFVDDSSLSKVLFTSLRAIAKLIKKSPDLFLDLEVHSTYGSLMCLFSCSKNRLGFALQDESHKAFLYTHLLYLNTSIPIRYCYSQLGQLAGMNMPDSKQEPLPPSLSDSEIMKVQERIDSIFDFEHKGIIVINPNASDLRYERRWSRANFAEVARYFTNQSYAVALVGSAAENKYVEGIVNLLGDDAKRVRNIAGSFSLLDFFAFLKKSCLVITNDSGVMNMALTLPVPHLLVAGPVNPEQYFIPNKFRTYIYFQTYCSPCTHSIDTPPCAGDNICMQQIKTADVIELSECLLRGEQIKPRRREGFSGNTEILGILKDKSKPPVKLHSIETLK